MKSRTRSLVGKSIDLMPTEEFEGGLNSGELTSLIDKIKSKVDYVYDNYIVNGRILAVFPNVVLGVSQSDGLEDEIILRFQGVYLFPQGSDDYIGMRIGFFKQDYENVFSKALDFAGKNKKNLVVYSKVKIHGYRDYVEPKGEP